VTAKDFPRFEEFDVDKDGYVSFDEWQYYLQQQAEIEDAKKSKGSKQSTLYSDLLSQLYDSQTNKVGNFQTMYENLDRGR
jgi:Ca2+-binding EF-hand superfamily protein